MEFGALHGGMWKSSGSPAWKCANRVLWASLHRHHAAAQRSASAPSPLLGVREVGLQVLTQFLDWFS